nr:hypothetical protein [Tanacetum cinerariifolium]
MVLSLDVSRKWPIHQLDVKNAFLNSDLFETVYMHQPFGFVVARLPNHVFRLQRSLYGLKQAPLLLPQLIDSLHREFDMTDLGVLNYFLGISVVRHSTGLPQVIVSFWVITYYLGPLNDSTLVYTPVPKLNTEALPTLWQRLHGFVIFSVSYTLLYRLQLLSTVITLVLFICLQTMFNINERNTLRSTFTSSVIWLPLVRLKFYMYLLATVLRVEKKMHVIEHPIPPAPAADSEANVLAEWNALYDAHNKVAHEFRSMFEKQPIVERFDLIQTFHACKQEEGKSITAYVLQMKGYVDQLERLGYVLPQDLTAGLILNGLTKDFAEFVRNYNMHNMGKTIGELHAMLIEYEKGLPKRAETPQVMMIKGGKIQKFNKKSLKAKEHPAKDETCHHCKEVGLWKRNYPIYLAEFLKKKKQVGIAGSSDNCHYAPSITRGVVSVHRLVENGFVQCFTNFGILVSKNNVFYFNAIPSNGIYEIDMHDIVPNVNSIYNVSTKRAKHNLDSTYLWHCRLAHISKKRIKKLQHEGFLKSTDDESFDQCVSCLSGKMTRKSFPHRPERATDILRIIHTDVCGPLRHVSRQGASYFITFTDDYNRYGYVSLLKHKHEVFETFKVFKNEVENQLGKTIKALRSDRAPYTPQHNGVTERRNRSLLDMVRSMMNLTTLSLSFLDYALESTTRILNMVPTKKVDKTPYELWYGKLSNLSYLKVWGCEVLVKRDTPDKLQQRSVKCIFICYPKETMGYYFYFPPEKKIVVARYAELFEKNLITQEVNGRAIDLEEIQDEDTSPYEITSKIPMEVEVEEHSLGDLNEPASYKSTMLDSDTNKWIDAMNAEIQSMIDNTVWVLVDLPPGCKTIKSKWIFKKKTDMDGIVHTYKARLVAKSYTQLYGVGYEETFSPVADIRAIRILISIAAFYDYEIWQMDIKIFF